MASDSGAAVPLPVAAHGETTSMSMSMSTSTGPRGGGRDADRAFLAGIETLIGPLTSVEEILAAIRAPILQRFRAGQVVFTTIDDGSGEVLAWFENLVAWPDVRSGRQHFHFDQYLSAPLRAELQLGVTVAVDDVATDPRTSERAELYARFGMRSQVLVPHLRDGRWVHLFAIQRPDVRPWSDAETGLIRDLAMRVSLRLERVEASDAIRRIDERYQTLFGLIDQGFCVIEVVFDDTGRPTDYRFIEANPAFEQQTGFVDPVGRRVREFAPDYEQRWFDVYGRVATTREPIRFVEHARDVGDRWYEVNAFPIGEPGSRRVGVLFNDISERRQAEDALRASEERFRTLFERSADAVALLSAAGQVLYLSDSVERVVGYRPEDVVMHHMEAYLHPDDYPGVMATLADLTSVAGAVAALTFRVRHRDGSWAWVEATFANHLGTPNLGVFVANFRNVTHRVELERQKDDFLAVATHELKTPVTSLKGYAQFLRNRFRKAGDEASAELMERMDSQFGRLTALIGDLLDVSRVVNGVLPLDPLPFDLDALAVEIAGQVQLTTDRHRIVVEPSGDAMLTADRDRTGQVLTNLLTNAVHYAAGGPVRLSVVAEADRVGLRVRDEGIGIPEREQGLVFDRFYRVAPQRHTAHPGLGLGLYISAEIIRRQGGEIWVESAEGAGSTFGFWLPRQPATTPDGDGSPPPGDSPRPS